MTRMVRVTKRKTHRIPGYLVVCLALCVIFFTPQLINIWQTNQEIKSLETQKTQLRQKYKNNQASAKLLRTEQTIEKMAREELGMIKPGEKVLVEVLDPEQARE